MLLGDLVQCAHMTSGRTGIVVDTTREEWEEFMVPPAVKVLWATGELQKEYETDLKVVSDESR